MRSAAAAIVAQSSPGDGVACMETYVTRALVHYLPKSFIVSDEDVPDGFGTVWVVTMASTPLPPHVRSYHAVASQRFEGIVLTKLVADDGVTPTPTPANNGAAPP